MTWLLIENARASDGRWPCRPPRSQLGRRHGFTRLLVSFDQASGSPAGSIGRVKLLLTNFRRFPGAQSEHPGSSPRNGRVRLVHYANGPGLPWQHEAALWRTPAGDGLVTCRMCDSILGNPTIFLTGSDMYEIPRQNVSVVAWTTGDCSVDLCQSVEGWPSG